MHHYVSIANEKCTPLGHPPRGPRGRRRTRIPTLHNPGSLRAIICQGWGRGDMYTWHSADLLVLFLLCNTTGAVRRTKNSQGTFPYTASELQTFPLAATHESSSILSPDIDVHYTVQQLLLNLHATSLFVSHPATATDIQELEDRVDDASDHTSAIVDHFRAHIEEATKIVRELRKAAQRMESVRSGVVVATISKLLLRGITPVQSRRRNRDS